MTKQAILTPLVELALNLCEAHTSFFLYQINPRHSSKHRNKLHFGVRKRFAGTKLKVLFESTLVEDKRPLSV